MVSIFGGLIGVTIAGVVLAHYHQLSGAEGLGHVMPIIMQLNAGACFLSLLLKGIRYRQKTRNIFIANT